jgi:hypothetical protein
MAIQSSLPVFALIHFHLGLAPSRITRMGRPGTDRTSKKIIISVGIAFILACMLLEGF